MKKQLRKEKLGFGSENINSQEADKLMRRSRILTLLDDYSKWLEERGYLDTDWRCEEPYAIAEYIKERNYEKKNMLCR